MPIKLKPQITAGESRLQKSARRGPTPPALLIHVEIGNALIVAAIEIVNGRDAELDRSVAHGVEDLPRDARGFNPPTASRPVVLTIT